MRRWLSGRLLLVTMAVAAAAPASADTSRTRVAAPATAARDCVGGFTLSGSATCLRLGGRVSAELGLRSAATAPTRSGLFHAGGRARIDMDARTPTELGPVRVHTSIRAPFAGVR